MHMQIHYTICTLIHMYAALSRDRPIMLIFLLIMLCCSAQFFTYYAQYYAHVKELCLKSDCSTRIYLLVSKIFLIW